MPRKKKETAPKTASRPKSKAAKPKAAAAKPKKPVKAKKAPAAKPKAPKPKTPAKPSAKSSWKPAKYGETQVVAFIRDPNCLFVYWEIASQKLDEVKAQLKGEYAKSRLVLRMFRDREDGGSDLIYEIEVNPEDMNRYLPVSEGGRGYFVEVARKTASGKVFVLARSNSLLAPGVGFSPQVDPTWAPRQELQDYLAKELELEIGPDHLPVSGLVGGISSAEAERRRRRFRETFSSPFGSQN
ncbi:MAG TPA: DUF4912 domain-containing protein [bacterium]|nr:DUF4912 domain-containing protein [bacterium]